MADTTKKASEILRDTLGIPQSDYAMMQFNARRYGMTDAEVEDAVLKMINASDSMKAAMAGGTKGRREFLLSKLPTEFGKTKTFNAKNVLEAIGAPFEKGGPYETPEEKLVALYRENPNLVRNRVIMNKEFGEIGGANLDKLVYAAQNYRKPKVELSWPNKIAGTVFYPRSLEAMKAGRTPGAKDIIGDVGEDLLMALPVGAGAAAAAAKLPRAAQVLAAIGANSMVPLISETYDASVYTPEENLDRSVFQGVDVATGAITNVVAPYMAGRVMGRGSRMLGTHTKPSTVLEGIPAGGSDEAKKVVDAWLENGSFRIPSKTNQNAARLNTWERNAMTAKSQPAYHMAAQGYNDYENGIINEATQKARADLLKFKEGSKALDDRARVAAGFMEAGKGYEDAIDMAVKLDDDVFNELFHRISVANAANKSRGEKVTEFLKASGGSFLSNRYGNQKHSDAGLAMLSNLFQAVDPELNLADKVQEIRDEQMKEAKDNYRKKIAGEVLAGGIGQAAMGSLGDPQAIEDAGWLSKIANNPGIVRGEGEGATDKFKNWWNSRGVVLLGQSGAFPGIKE